MSAADGRGVWRGRLDFKKKPVKASVQDGQASGTQIRNVASFAEWASAAPFRHWPGSPSQIELRGVHFHAMGLCQSLDGPSPRPGTSFSSGALI
jgi:hypothetical protein